jgi:hypothetical protein
MRGDSVGVGDIGAVQGGTWGSGDTTGGDDGRGAEREQDGSVLSGPWLYEHYISKEPSGVGIGISNSARVESCACFLHSDCTVRADGMRGNRLGVGNISAVQGRTRGSGDEESAVDGMGAFRQWDCSILNGH